MQIKKQAAEKDIEDAILKYLNLQYQCFAFKVNTKGTWNPKAQAFMKTPKWMPRGMCDIVGIFGGKFFAFEVKTPSEHKKFVKSKGEHEIEQKAMIDHIRSKGGLAEVVSTLDQVIAYLGNLTAIDLKIL